MTKKTLKQDRFHFRKNMSGKKEVIKNANDKKEWKSTEEDVLFFTCSVVAAL